METIVTERPGAESLIFFKVFIFQIFFLRFTEI